MKKVTLRTPKMRMILTKFKKTKIKKNNNKYKITKNKKII